MAPINQNLNHPFFPQKSILRVLSYHLICILFFLPTTSRLPQKSIFPATRPPQTGAQPHTGSGPQRRSPSQTGVHRGGRILRLKHPTPRGAGFKVSHPFPKRVHCGSLNSSPSTSCSSPIDRPMHPRAPEWRGYEPLRPRPPRNPHSSPSDGCLCR